MANNMGGNTSTSISGSRVVSGSTTSGGGSISASGDGLGQANTFSRSGANGQVVGGYQPRTNPVQTENIDTNSPQSASGTNESNTPTEGANQLPEGALPEGPAPEPAPEG